MYGRVVAEINAEAEMKIVRYEATGAATYGALQDDGSIRELIGSPFEDFSVGDAVADFGMFAYCRPSSRARSLGSDSTTPSTSRKSG